MVVAERVLDALTVLVALTLGWYVRPRWMPYIVMAAFCFVGAWFTHIYYAGWLGENIPGIVLAAATFGLAALGGHVALYPPREAEKGLRVLYFVMFWTLALFGIAANVWQINEDKKRQRTRSGKRMRKRTFPLIWITSRVQMTPFSRLSPIPPRASP